MPTGDQYIGLYAGKILGLLALEEKMITPLRASVRAAMQDLLAPAGGVMDTAPSFTVAANLFTLDSDKEAYTPEGYKLVLDASAAIWQDVPFANSGATVYTLGAAALDLPTAAEVGTDGQYGFASFEEGIGRQTTPDSVATDGGDGMILTMTAALFTGEKWALGAGTSRPVRVWYQTAQGRPLTASSEAVYDGVLEDNGTDYVINVPHIFGQTSINATTARYKVAILGPEPAVAARAGTSGFTEKNAILGTITSGVYATTGVTVLTSFGVLASAFAAEHDATTGAHKNITTTSTGTYPNLWTRPADAAGNASNAIEVRNNGGTAKVALLPGSSSAAAGGGKVAFPRPDLSADNTASIEVGAFAGTSRLKITNPHATTSNVVEVVIDGAIYKDTTKTAPFGAFVNSGSAFTFVFDNVGAGSLSVQIAGGNLDVSDDIQYGGRLDGPAFSVNSTGDAAANSVEVTDYFLANPNTSGLPGFTYVNPTTFNRDVSPYAGGWTVTSANGIAWVSGTPPYIQGAVALGTITLRRPLDVLVNENIGTNADTLYRLLSVEWRYIRQTGSTVSLALVRVLRDGTGAPTAVATSSPAVAGSFTLATLTLNHDMDPDYYYYLEITLLPAATADVQIADVRVRLEKEAVE